MLDEHQEAPYNFLARVLLQLISEDDVCSAINVELD